LNKLLFSIISIEIQIRDAKTARIAKSLYDVDIGLTQKGFMAVFNIIHTA